MQIIISDGTFKSNDLKEGVVTSSSSKVINPTDYQTDSNYQENKFIDSNFDYSEFIDGIGSSLGGNDKSRKKSKSKEQSGTRVAKLLSSNVGSRNTASRNAICIGIYAVTTFSVLLSTLFHYCSIV